MYNIEQLLATPRGQLLAVRHSAELTSHSLRGAGGLARPLHEPSHQPTTFTTPVPGSCSQLTHSE